MPDIIKVLPIFKEKIWGGQKLKDYFGYHIPNEPIGECWAISGHPKGDCKIDHPKYPNMTVSELYKKYRETLFNNHPNPEFPLLIKYLDATDKLSIQIHPDDEYAQIHENSLGKTECWLVLDAKEDSTLILGHNSTSKEEFINKVNNNDLTLWRYHKVSKGDFYYIPSKTVHAINEGVLLYEVQQSSDITYRIYDYDREDKFGNKRDLHINQALKLINVPSQFKFIEPLVNSYEKLKKVNYISNEYFTLNEYRLDGEFTFSFKRFILVNILKGRGTINDQIVKQGDNLIIVDDQDFKFIIKGEVQFVIVE